MNQKKSLLLRPHLIYFFLVLIFYHCNPEPHTSKKNLDEVILSDTSSFYYVDVNNYPVKNKKLPIGIFDSGTGGWTVMDAIVNYDGFNNQNKDLSSDGILDFEKECFIYLADQANMPYGNYPSLNKTDVLKEHILKVGSSKRCYTETASPYQPQRGG